MTLVGRLLGVHGFVCVCITLAFATLKKWKEENSLCEVVGSGEGLVAVIADIRSLLSVRSNMSLKMF